MTDGSRGQDIDCVIFGTNCADELLATLESVKGATYTRGSVRMIYVDGGSSDGSAQLARDFGVEVVEKQEATRAEGYNAGLKAATGALVQFLEVGAVLDEEWFQVASKNLAPDVAAIFGQQRERHAEASRFNKIADLEWNPIHSGDAEVFGGDLLIRRALLDAAGGFDEELVAGESGDLSLRLREQGHRVLYVAESMVTVDSQIIRWDQYWRRYYRMGYGRAAIYERHGKAGGPWATWMQHIVLRGGLGLLLVFLGLIALGWNTLWLVLWIPAALLILHPRIFRVGEFREKMGLTNQEAALYAWHRSLVVIPQFFGVARHRWAKWTGKPMKRR